MYVSLVLLLVSLALFDHVHILLTHLNVRVVCLETIDEISVEGLAWSLLWLPVTILSELLLTILSDLLWCLLHLLCVLGRGEQVPVLGFRRTLR